MERRKQDKTIIWEFEDGGLWPFLEFEIQTNKWLKKTLHQDDDINCVWCPHALEVKTEGLESTAFFKKILVIYSEHSSVGVCADCVDKAIDFVKKKEREEK